MSNERKYMLRTLEGEEYGPVDQECLIRWAQAGRVTAMCEIRSTLITRWDHAKDVSFLREIVMAQDAEKEEREVSMVERVRRRMILQASEVVEGAGLHRMREEDYERAPIPYRVLAAVVDGFFLLAYLVFIYLAFAFLVWREILFADLAFYLGIMLGYIGILMYFTWTTCFHTQTPGQRFWGIMLMKKGGGEFYLGRCFVYTVLMLSCGILTPLFMFLFGSKRGVQEMITGTRMVRVKLVGKRR